MIMNIKKRSKLDSACEIAGFTAPADIDQSWRRTAAKTH